MKLPPLSQLLQTTGTIILSGAFAGVSSYLGKRIYDISLEVIAKRIPCPYIELLCMGVCLTNAAYLSLKLGRSVLEKRPISDRPIKPFVSLSQSVGQPEGPTPEEELSARAVRQAARASRRELVAFAPGEAGPGSDKDDSFHEHS